MDRVKAAIFSSLGEEVIGAHVLDLFAGTGALGNRSAQSRRGLSLVCGRGFRRDRSDRTKPGPDKTGGRDPQSRMSLPFFVRRESRGRSGSFLPIRLTRKRNRVMISPACFWEIRDWRKCWSRPGSLCSRSVPRSKCRGSVVERHSGEGLRRHRSVVLATCRSIQLRRERTLNDPAFLQSSLSARAVAFSSGADPRSCCDAEIISTNSDNDLAFMIATCNRDSRRAVAHGSMR